MIGQHLEAGCLHQRGPATYGNIFSLARAFTITRMFLGFPFSLKEIPQHLSDFHFSAFSPFFTPFKVDMEAVIHCGVVSEVLIDS